MRARSEKLENFLKQIERDIHNALLPELAIYIPVSKIRKCKYELIEGDAHFGSTRVLCVVASSRFSTIIPALAKLRDDDNINILDYFPQLVSTGLKKIGVVSFQNGIRNSEKDFKAMAELIFRVVPNNPLIIGIYNPTHGLKDFARQLAHLRYKFSETALRTRVLINLLSEKLQSVCPSVLWLHLMHSEAGALAHLTLKSFPVIKRRQIKQRLITAAYGPLFPISEDLVLAAYNTYSEKDFVTGLFASTFSHQLGYEEIKFVPCLDETILNIDASARANRLPDDAWTNMYDLMNYDHDFAGATYQQALRDDIAEISRRFRFL